MIGSNALLGLVQRLVSYLLVLQVLNQIIHCTFFFAYFFEKIISILLSEMFSSFYTLPPCILTLCLYASRHFSGYLSHQTLPKMVEGAASCEVTVRCHFHINAADMVGIGNSMWRWEVSLSRSSFSHPLPPLWL